jgi:hypothetical protein
MEEGIEQASHIVKDADSMPPEYEDLITVWLSSPIKPHCSRNWDAAITILIEPRHTQHQCLMHR